MEKPAGKGLTIAYNVMAVIFALMMFFSASTKLMLNPAAVHVIHDIVGFPVNLFPLLAASEIAGGLGLLAGIFRPKLGVAASVGLILYFICAMIAHVRVQDWAGLKAPVTPFLLSIAILVLRILSMRRAASQPDHASPRRAGV
jgi:DoxX-like family